MTDGEGMTKRTVVARPGGRTERNRKSVADAVLHFVRQGRLDFEIQEIAMLSGVHRATISRRWPDRGSLMAEAMAEHVAQFSVHLTGNWEDDIRHIIDRLWTFFREPTEMSMNRMIALTDNHDFHEKMRDHWMPRISQLQEPLRNAKRDGLVRAEVDEQMIILMIASFLVMFTALTRLEIDNDLPRTLADQIIQLCRVN